MVDYKEVLLTLVPVAPRTQHLCSFLCELTLLHTSLSIYAPARLASAALLLARLMHGQSKERPSWGLWRGDLVSRGRSWIRQVGREEINTSSFLLEKKEQQYRSEMGDGARRGGARL